MIKENPKKIHEKILYSKITLIFLIVLIFFMSKGLLSLYEKKQSTGESLALAEAEMDRAMGRTELLEEKLESFETQKGIEMEIRDMFNVAKEGERVIVIVDAEESLNTEVEDSEGVFSRVINFIKFWGE